MLYSQDKTANNVIISQKLKEVKVLKTMTLQETKIYKFFFFLFFFKKVREFEVSDNQIHKD